MNFNIVNPEEIYKPICVACDERGEYTLATEERHGEPYCSNCAQNRDEHAYERMVERFYGGSGASDGSITEFCARAAADKARGR